ncbi:MAG: FRG domain-containing protein [Caulobacter sp.]
MTKKNRKPGRAEHRRNPRGINPILAMSEVSVSALHSHYPTRLFDTDRSYFRFALDLLRILGQHNTIETHGLTYEPVLLPRASQGRERLSRHAPPELQGLDLAAMGLVLVDGEIIQNYLPMSHFDTGPVRAAFGKTTLVDPFYGIAFFEADGRWREFAFAVDDLFRQTENNPALRDVLFRSPGDVLDTGLSIGRAMLKDLLPTDARDAQARHEIPEVRIGSLKELHKWAADLKALKAQYPKLGVWFRGQPCEFLTPDRSLAVARGAMGHARFRDASLVPSVYRNFRDHYANKTTFSRFLDSLFVWHDAARPLIGPSYEIVPLGAPPSRPALGEHAEFSVHTYAPDGTGGAGEGHTKHYHRQADFLRHGLLLQHYGCPTPFLDVTSSVDVAHWFATHVPGGDTLFQPSPWSGSGPCIYVFLAAEDVLPVYDSAVIDDERKSLRAHRQECGLIGGSGLLVQNFPARYIALKLRLDEGLGPAKALSEEELFPGPEDDPMLAALLDSERLRQERLFPIYGRF